MNTEGGQITSTAPHLHIQKESSQSATFTLGAYSSRVGTWYIIKWGCCAASKHSIYVPNMLCRCKRSHKSPLAR